MFTKRKFFQTTHQTAANVTQFYYSHKQVICHEIKFPFGFLRTSIFVYFFPHMLISRFYGKICRLFFLYDRVVINNLSFDRIWLKHTPIEIIIFKEISDPFQVFQSFTYALCTTISPVSFLSFAPFFQKSSMICICQSIYWNPLEFIESCTIESERALRLLFYRFAIRSARVRILHCESLLHSVCLFYITNSQFEIIFSLCLYSIYFAKLVQVVFRQYSMRDKCISLSTHMSHLTDIRQYFVVTKV